jgi:hypothetical protein
MVTIMAVLISTTLLSPSEIQRLPMLSHHCARIDPATGNIYDSGCACIITADDEKSGNYHCVPSEKD